MLTNSGTNSSEVERSFEDIFLFGFGSQRYDDGVLARTYDTSYLLIVDMFVRGNPSCM